MTTDNEYKPVKTVGELREAIKDLPADMKVGSWEPDWDTFHEQVNAAPKRMYRDSNGCLTPYNWSDENVPFELMLDL